MWRLREERTQVNLKMLFSEIFAMFAVVCFISFDFCPAVEPYYLEELKSDG